MYYFVLCSPLPIECLERNMEIEYIFQLFDKGSENIQYVQVFKRKDPQLPTFWPYLRRWICFFCISWVSIGHFHLCGFKLLIFCAYDEIADQGPLYLVLLIVYHKSKGDGQKIWPDTHKETTYFLYTMQMMGILKYQA